MKVWVKRPREKIRGRESELVDDVRGQGLSFVFAGNKIKIYPVRTE